MNVARVGIPARRRQSRVEAARLVAEYERSGQTRQAFCAQHGLPVAMIQSSFRALLMAAIPPQRRRPVAGAPAIGGPPLLPACRDAAESAAITLPAVTVQTDPEHSMASAATSLP